MNSRSLLAALATAVVALPCSGFAFAGDRFEWPELPYEPCFRVERVLAPTDICSQGGSAFGRAINAHGTIVGSANCGAGNSRAFIWRMNEPFQWIPTPQGTSFSWAWAINDDGLVAGTLGNGNGFAWHEGTGEFHLIPSPIGSGAVRINGVNAHGVIVGDVLSSEQSPPVRGFHWHAGTLTFLDDTYDFDGRAHVPMDISDDGVITGYLYVPGSGTGSYRPFLVTDDRLIEFDPFPGGWQGTTGVKVYLDGGFIGQTWNHPDLPSGSRHTVRGSTAGYFRAFEGHDQFLRTTPYDANAAGDVVAFGRLLNDDWDGAVLIRHGVVRQLKSLIVPSSSAPNVLTAMGISGTGEIAATNFHLVPAPAPLGDLSRNCRRDLGDLILLLGSWGDGAGPADLNGDGRVDLNDLLMLLQFIGEDQSL